MLKNDTPKNGTSHIGLYGSAPPPPGYICLYVETKSYREGDNDNLKYSNKPLASEKQSECDFVQPAKIIIKIHMSLSNLKSGNRVKRSPRGFLPTLTWRGLIQYFWVLNQPIFHIFGSEIPSGNL